MKRVGRVEIPQEAFLAVSRSAQAIPAVIESRTVGKSRWAIDRRKVLTTGCCRAFCAASCSPLLASICNARITLRLVS